MPLISKRGIGACLGAAAVCALAAPTLASADAVTDWNGYASNAIVATAGQPAPVSALSFAMVQGAVYDAVNAIDGEHRPYLAQPPAAPSDSKDAAAATAAYHVLVDLFPGQESTLGPLYHASLDSVEDTPPGAKAGGIAAGEAAAAAMIAARTNDGRFGPFTPVIGTTPGAWRPTPLPTPPLTLPGPPTDPAGWVQNVRPFVVPSAEMLRSDGPNALTSRAYARDFNEVKTVGALNSTTRTPDQTDAAIFWQAPVFGLWNGVFRGLVASHGLSTADSARLFAMENMAAADAAIGCWNDKYHWNFWRPITAIREAAGDGNAATEADPTWTPLFDPSTHVATPPALITPPFPDHPSGHNCAAGAVLRTMRYFFGTDEVSFDLTSPKTGTTRSFHSLSDTLKENINARVWAGIHFRTADIQGARLGKKVARYVHRHEFQPVR